MVFQEAVFKVACNSGFKSLKMFKVLKGSYRRTAKIGDIMVASVQSKKRASGIPPTEKITRNLIVNLKKPLRRKDGSYIKFDNNSCVVLGEDLKPRASRVLHPLPLELRNTIYSKLLFLTDIVL